jgi:peptidoglycan hydrolase-like protein with peptidoglycan-binding domain
LAVGGMVGAFAAGRVNSSSQRASVATAPSRSIVAASVKEGPLKETVRLEGLIEVPAGSPLRIPQQSTSQRSVYTDILLAPGQTVVNGDIVAEVSGRPVFAIRGEFPFYRDLHTGDSGPDVRQLQQALQEIVGLPRSTGTMNASTAHAIDKLYARSGYRSTREPAPTTNTPSKPSPSPHGYVDSKAESTTTTQAGSSRVFMSSADFLVVAKMPITVKEVGAQVGADATGDIATTIVGSPRIVVDVPPARQFEVSLWGSSVKGLATIGAQAFSVTLDTRATAPTFQPSPSGSPNDPKASSTVSAVFLASSTDLARVVGQTATVDVTLRESAPGSLILPLSGLWTDSTGQTSIRLVERGIESASIPVHVSLVVDGMAAVSSNDSRLRVGAFVLTGYASATNPNGLDLTTPAGS